jgi:hypothetical protein
MTRAALPSQLVGGGLGRHRECDRQHGDAGWLVTKLVKAETTVEIHLVSKKLIRISINRADDRAAKRESQCPRPRIQEIGRPPEPLTDLNGCNRHEG